MGNVHCGADQPRPRPVMICGGRPSHRRWAAVAGAALAAVRLSVHPLPTVAAGDVEAPVRLADSPFSSSSVGLIVAGIFISAMANAVFGITTSAVRQITTPHRLLPSVMAVNYTLATVAVAIGTLGGGLLGSRAGPGTGILVGSGITVAAGLISLGGRLGSVQARHDSLSQSFSSMLERSQPTSSGLARLREGRPGEGGLLSRMTVNLDPIDEPPPERCASPGCREGGMHRCSYTDQHGRNCPTAWCSAHAESLDGLPVCARHKVLVNGLGLRLFQHDQLPDVDSWASSVAVWVGRQVDPELRQGLAVRYPKSDGYAVVRDRVERIEGPNGPEWRTRWRVLGRDGTILVTTVVVTEEPGS